MEWKPIGRSGARERRPDWVDERSREAGVRPGFRPRKKPAKQESEAVERPKLTRVGRIGDSVDPMAIPVRDLQPAIDYYVVRLGFSLHSREPESARLVRDEVEVGLVRHPAHDPATAGSYFFGVRGLRALRSELIAAGAAPGEIQSREHDGKPINLFFTREGVDGYCYCFGERPADAAPGSVRS
jgi:catechol 2,3-dioxygenase-like lactoylglutathione lyase family enzyme